MRNEPLPGFVSFGQSSSRTVLARGLLCCAYINTLSLSELLNDLFARTKVLFVVVFCEFQEGRLPTSGCLDGYMALLALFFFDISRSGQATVSLVCASITDYCLCTNLVTLPFCPCYSSFCSFPFISFAFCIAVGTT